MNRFTTSLALSCALLIGLAHAVSAQTPTPTFFDTLRPFLTEIASVFVAAIVAWLAKSVREKLGIDIEAGHRDALQAALTNAAGLAIAKAGDAALAIRLPKGHDFVEDALDYVRRAAPDAMKHFGLTPDAVRDKLRAKIGVLASGALPAGKV